MKISKFAYLPFLFLYFFANSQQILVSPMLNIRNDDYFNLIGQVGNKILSFRSNDKKYILNIFDKNLNRYTEKKIKFEKKKIEILSISAHDNNWVIVYLYRYKNKEMIKAFKLDDFGNKLDSTLVLTQTNTYTSKKYARVTSEDENTLLLFRKRSQTTMDFIELDLLSLKKPFFKQVKFNDVNLNYNFRKVLVSNAGNFYVLFEKKPTLFNKSKYKIIINSFYPRTDDRKKTSKNLKLYSSDIIAKYDNKNDKLIIVGLATKSYNSKAKGYYILKYGKNLKLNKTIQHDFNNSLLNNFYKLQNKRTKKYLRKMSIKDLLLRNDGGALLVLEKKEILSRQYQDGMRRRQQFTKIIEYVFEEIILISIHNDGEEFWNKIIPKHQFSSNDFGIYSSFFTFKNPSLLKLIFNDEIKNENQIMMYSINPMGTLKRHALFSTDLYKMNLAFLKSIQISNSKILVPSYKKDKLKLVLIDFKKGKYK